MTERILNDRYALETKVGEGGMAITYRARDLLLNRTVAIKLMREQFTTDPQFVERFRREAQSAARLSHENIAGVYDTGKADGTYYIVMEFVEGTDLKQRLRRDGPLPILTALEIAGQIAAALEAAHANGLVHRDIKPHNILLNRDGKVKVTDFGIAKLVSSDTEDTGVIIGSVHYLSPEQARGEATTPVSDLYALGAVLFEMLTAHTVFEGENAMAVAYKQIHNPPPHPRTLRADIPAALETLVLRCLEKDPRARFLSAAEVKAALAQIANRLAQEETVVIAAPTQPADATLIYRKPANAAHEQAYPPQVGPATEPAAPRGGSGGAWVIAILFLLLAGAVGYGGYKLLNPVVMPPPPDSPLTVPNLIGLDAQNAEMLLKRRGVIGQTGGHENNDMDPGKVCRQDPAPNTAIDPKTPVFYYISDGPATKLMPDVSQMSEPRAKSEIRTAMTNNAFVFNKPKTEASDTVNKGFVIRTEPAAGAQVDRLKGRVTLVLSSGPPQSNDVLVTYHPGAAPDLGNDMVFVRIELEQPAGSDPQTVLEKTFKPGDAIPDQQFQRKPDQTIVVRLLAAKDENSPLTSYGEETFAPTTP